MDTEFDIKEFAKEVGGKIQIHIHNCTPHKVKEISKQLGKDGEYWAHNESSGVRFSLGNIQINTYFKEE